MNAELQANINVRGCIFNFLKNKGGYGYGTEHQTRIVPNTGIQPGRKERIHNRHNHEQETG